MSNESNFDEDDSIFKIKIVGSNTLLDVSTQYFIFGFLEMY